MTSPDTSTSGAIKRLEALANEHQATAQALRAHAQALRQILGGAEPAPTQARSAKAKGKGGVSAATRKKLSELMKKRWAEKKAGA